MRPFAFLSALRRHRVVAVLAVVAIAAAGVAAPRLLWGPKVPALEVRTRPFTQTVVASGHVEAPHRVTIGTQVLGSVREVPVAEGQTVSAGQVLVRLDDRELRATVDQADAAVLQAEARLRQLAEVGAPVSEQVLRQATVNLDNARAQWRRTQDLFDRGFVGQAALDDSRKTLNLAESQERTAQRQADSQGRSGSDHAIAVATLAQARAAAAAARTRLAYATIVAPVAGTLISRAVEPGDIVQAGKALMTLSPSGDVQLVVQVDERNLSLLKLGQPARASADAYPDQRFDATLAYINPGVDLQRGAVAVKLTVADPPAYLRQDMTVSVNIETARHDAVLTVPTDALREADGPSPWVLKVDGHRARRQGVRLGMRGRGQTQILEGLAAGDLIVAPGARNVVDGTRLRPVRIAAPG